LRDGGPVKPAQRRKRFLRQSGLGPSLAKDSREGVSDGDWFNTLHRWTSSTLKGKLSTD
jgi:hypothetical protein